MLGKKTHVINQLGVARTFQNIRLFPALTALENVKVGVETRQKSGPIAADARHALAAPRGAGVAPRRPTSCCAFVGLTRRANDLAGSLAYGEQRRLEIARALGTDPGVILLDEPAAGTNPVEKQELAALIRKINVEDDISVLLIEHDMKLVMSVAAPAGGAQLRREDRRGHPGADPAGPGRDRGLPRHLGGRGPGDDRGPRGARRSTSRRALLDEPRPTAPTDDEGGQS